MLCICSDVLKVWFVIDLPIISEKTQVSHCALGHQVVNSPQFSSIPTLCFPNKTRYLFLSFRASFHPAYQTTSWSPGAPQHTSWHLFLSSQPPPFLAITSLVLSYALFGHLGKRDGLVRNSNPHFNYESFLSAEVGHRIFEIEAVPFR